MIIHQIVAVRHHGVELMENAFGFVEDHEIIGLEPLADSMKGFDLYNEKGELRQRPCMVHVGFERRQKSDVGRKDAEL